MKRKSGLLQLLLLMMPVTTVFSQVIVRPNQALKSHETLIIQRIEAGASNTVIYMQVENRITGGNFCADRNIYIVFPDGTRSMLVSSNGIPVCPDTYKFKYPGEQLDFLLTFPPLRKGTEWIDLVEDCSENCFSFYGITLDDNLNKKIDDAFELVENEEPVKALVSFIAIAEEIDDKNLGAEGLIYINIIKLAKGMGNTLEAAEWYRRLKSSGAPRIPLYVKYLNSQGITY